MRKDAVFSNAVCKAAEVDLLTPEALLRLSAADFDEAIKMLHDYGYNEGVITEGSFDIDRFIGGQISALIGFVKEYSPSSEVEDFIVAPYLFNNIKAEYKRKRGGAKTRLYDIDGAAGVADGDYSRLDAKIKEVLLSLDEQEVSSSDIDLALTKAMYEYKLKKAKKSGSGLLVKYAKAEIDTVNIITMQRSAKLNMSEAEKTKLFITGGNIKTDTEDLPKEYAEFDLNDLIKLETQADNYLLQLADSQSSNMDSVGPLLSYALRKSIEFKTVKMILVCIKSDARREIPLRLRGLL